MKKVRVINLDCKKCGYGKALLDTRFLRRSSKSVVILTCLNENCGHQRIVSLEKNSGKKGS